MWFPRVLTLVALLICTGCQESAPTAVPVVKPTAVPSDAASETTGRSHALAQTVPHAGTLSPTGETKPTARITFRDLAFDWSRIDRSPPKWYEPGSAQDYKYDRELVPAQALALRGRRVTLAGRMPTTIEDETVHQFLLLKDFDERPKLSPPLDQKVMVTLRGGQTTVYQFSQVAVCGLFRVDEWIDPEDQDGNPSLVYHLDDAIVLHPTQ